MKSCPITLDPVEGPALYSRAGLRALHPRIEHLLPLPLTWEEQLREARLRADKMSIQGVQPKLSAVLKPGEARFAIVDRDGRFILKPNPPPFEEVPANESLTMTLARVAGIETPLHGLVPACDGSWVYFVRRFDRVERNSRLHQEDFAQLTGAGRETKYSSSLEQVAKVLESHCTFPAIEKPRLARLLLFCYLTGNEDMHLKNFSLIVRDGVVRLAPAYDLLNTSLVLGDPTEESALPLRGKKRKLTRHDWLDYLCRERLELPDPIIDGLLRDLGAACGAWTGLIERSFLSPTRKSTYRQLIDERAKRLGLMP